MNKRLAISFFEKGTRLLRRLPGGNRFCEQFLVTAVEAQAIATHNGVHMVFGVPNALCRYRASSFATKEPQTLDWIDALPSGAILWDVGANVGLYSVYAAMKRDAQVYAFEPSVFNLEQLARNIHLNKLQRQITIVPVALSARTGASLFKMTSTAWGGALSTFDRDFGYDGEALKEVFEYTTCGISMGDAISYLGIPPPQFIKMDVDGIEHLILEGGKAVLQQVEGVLVEINDDFTEQARQASQCLSEAGLTLHRKCDLGVGNQYNQWWIREHAELPS